uniref:Uncharacterized protein n=1 Tax=viral metagenome TaxID=1070528 RepID=A0A6C0HSY7_9ZZZZ
MSSNNIESQPSKKEKRTYKKKQSTEPAFVSVVPGQPVSTKTIPQSKPVKTQKKEIVTQPVVQPVTVEVKIAPPTLPEESTPLSNTFVEKKVEVSKKQEEYDDDEDYLSRLDTIVRSVVEKYIDRSMFGKQKYGTTLDRDDLNILDWINHTQEELMDATLYLEKLKKTLIEHSIRSTIYANSVANANANN